MVSSITSPPPGSGQSGLTTTVHYNTMMQPTNVVYPDGTSASITYTLCGDVRQVSGSGVYPAAFMYDYNGRMTNMTAWPHFPATNGAEVTSWTYHPNSGWLVSKSDNSGNTTSYSNTPAGRLASRTWARGTNTSYSYNSVKCQAVP